MKLKAIDSESLISPEDQSADFVELFFDLVFVFAITRITHLTAHHIDLPHILRSLLVFWLIWWGWTQFTWTLNTANTKHPQIRLGTLTATGIAFAMAVSTDQAFGDGVMWFALPYVAVRALGLWMQFRVTAPEDGSRTVLYVWAGLSIVGLVAVLGGAFSNPLARVWWWLAAIGLDFIAGLFGGNKEGWNIRAKHFSERHSLIVIIALGESLIVAAGAVSTGERTIGLAVAGGLAVLVTCLLWWSYFAWIREHMEHALLHASGISKTSMGRDVFSFIHYPLVCGIIGIAIGFENILSHPEVPISMPVALSFGVGVILFVGSTAASVWKSSGVILIPRVAFVAVIAGCTYLFIGRSSEFALGLTAAMLLLLLAVEWRMQRTPVARRSASAQSRGKEKPAGEVN
jgi:low temperature requirement protein LtrA